MNTRRSFNLAMIVLLCVGLSLLGVSFVVRKLTGGATPVVLGILMLLALAAWGGSVAGSLYALKSKGEPNSVKKIVGIAINFFVALFPLIALVFNLIQILILRF